MTTSRREIALGSAVALASVAVVLTEILSLFGALHRTALLVSWVVVTFAAGFVVRRLRSRILLQRADSPRIPIDVADALLLAAIGTVLVLIAVTAIVAAPNTFDSMTYHLSRVAHWHRNHSVAFYATSIPRQLYQVPGAEYLVAQVYVLFDGDRFVNMVQWWALLGSALGVSSIAERLGARRRGQLLAALACVTLPMAVLQGSSTQNDMVASLWMVCTLIFVARLVDSWSLTSTLLTGASLGLALLTKATAPLFLAPLAPAILVAAYRRRDRRSWLALGGVAALAVFMCLPHLLRTHELFGHPLGPLSRPGAAYSFLIEPVTPKTVISGAVRNFGLQAASSSGTFNRWLEGSIRATLGALDIDPDDPRTTWTGQSFAIKQASRDEDAAGNPVHLLLLLAVVAGLLVSPNRHRRLLLYSAALAAGLLLFSALVTWMPWHTRLQLPLLVLATPLIGARLPRRGSRVVALTLAVVLVAAASGPLLYNQRRPLLPPGSIGQTVRAQQYFAGHPSVQQSYLEALRILEEELRCVDVGLWLGPNDYEYPLWALAGEVGGQPMRFTHVTVSNASARLQDPLLVPCAVLLSAGREQERLTVGGEDFEVAYDLGALRVLRPTGQ